MIELKKISCTLNERTPLEKTILKQLDLRISAHEFVTVIGTNGAGKSTLLNIISGERSPSSGSIEIDRSIVTQGSSYERSSWVARVFQDPLLGSCGDLTISENMALASCRGKSRGLRQAVTSELRNTMKQILAPMKLGLEDKLDLPMNQLSGGQRQAVSLMMATLSPAKILLLDEHTSALDPKTAQMIMTLTDQIVRERKLTVLMVTHSLSHALRYGTRTLLLHEGQIAADLSGETRSQMTSHQLLDLYGSFEDSI